MCGSQAEEIHHFPFSENKTTQKNDFISYGELFIHYNTRLFGGTRNEYRLTGMTKCLRYVNATAGDTIKLLRDENGIYWFEHHPANKAKRDAGSPLRLGNTWKVVNIK